MVDKKEKNQKLNLKIESKNIYPGALFIIRRLNNLGYKAFAVGGGIRSLVMGERSNDWDVTTETQQKRWIKFLRTLKLSR
jgi:tRNA nucleotidyltransferase/poly(A) polymerase